jgi:hypothetical protein
MSAVSTKPREAIAAVPVDPAPVLARARAVAAKVVARRRTPRKPGPLDQFLTTVAVVVASYTGWWALCLLHGHARILTAGGVSVTYLVGSALRRRGWLG